MTHKQEVNSAPLLDVEPAPELRHSSASVRTLRSVVFTSAFALVTYYVLFRLPFLFPPRQRLSSASYAFGFNNGVAILALAALVAILTLIYLLRPGRVSRLAIALVDQPAQPKRTTRWTFAIVSIGYAVLTFLMYIYDVHAAPRLMWETRHLLHRTLLMDLYGLRPYTEIAAEYGPILTYAPLVMYWLIKPLGASHELAYFACHLVLNLAGLWCAYYVLSRAVMPMWARILTFVLVAVAGFAPYMGVNGVLARYLCPFAALLVGHRAVTWALSKRNCLVVWGGVAVSILFLLVANILLSPEAGVAFALAWLSYAAFSLYRQPRILVVSLIAVVGAACLCWLLLPVEYYGTLLRFSQGANNLPLLPAAHLLLYITTLLLLVPSLLVVGIRNWRSDEQGGAAICGAFGVLCLVMSPGALGRCDPPHALLFGMGASMLLMICLANSSRRAFMAYAVAYAAVFSFFIEAVNVLVFYGISHKTLLSPHPIAAVMDRFRTTGDTTHPDTATLSKLDRYPRLGLPYASFGDPVVERYLITHGKLVPEYYVATVGVYDSAALERKLRDIGKAEYLLVPTNLEPPGESCALYLKSIRSWFLYPAKLPCRAKPLDPTTAVKSFISGHYIPVEQIGSWSVLRRVGLASP
jgi:hypothetical protein